MKNKVLVVAAHPDDEVLGCGATISRHIKRGDSVTVLIMAEGAASRVGLDNDKEIAKLKECARLANAHLGVKDLRFFDYPDNKMDTLPLLNVIQEIEKVLFEIKPQIIYTHSFSDVNIDHKIISQAIEAATRPLPKSFVKTVLSFEIPSSTEWATSSPAFFRPNWFNDVSNEWGTKIEALKFYETEMREYPHPRSYKAVEHLMKWRGATVGVEAAEAFMVLRNVVV